MTCVRQAALAAHDAGLCVVPPRRDGSKAPEGQWKQYQSTRPGRGTVEAWYEYEAGRSGLGLVCGIVSGGLEMLEFEGRAVRAGLVDEFDRLANDSGLGPLIERMMLGYCEQTPSGGLHLLYRCAEIEGNQKLAADENGEVLIETRGEGGYVIVAPSNGTTHPSGGAWVLTDGGFAAIATITTYERAQLLALCRQFDQAPARHPEISPAATPRSATADDVSAFLLRPSGSSWVDDVIADFNARTSWAEVLEPHGWERAGSLNHNGHPQELWRRPGKTDGHSATTNANGTDHLIVFSTSTPFGTEPTSYDRFSALVLLTTGRSDKNARTECARRLREQGYGPVGATGTGQPIVRVTHGADISGPPSGTDPDTGGLTGAPGHGDEERADDHDPTLYLPAEFWEARDYLKHIRLAARSAMVAPDAVLNTVLARTAAITPHTVDLPGLVGGAVGLTYYGANVGASEHGKSAAAKVAQRLIPDAPDTVADHMPIGSGEGYVEVLFEYDPEEKTKVQRRYGAIFYIDEGGVLGELAGRSGATLLPTLRSAFTHATLGATNASKERRRIVQGTQYVYGITMGIQPELAGPLLADAPAGTPQRFVWLRADDPWMTAEPLDWPGQLDWQPPDAGQLEPYLVNDGGWSRHRMHVAAAISAEVRADRVAAQNERRPPLEAHRMLVRLKIAALLAILDDRLDVNNHDWELAGAVADTSRRVRQAVERDLALVARQKEEANTERVVRRELTLDGSREARALGVMARAIGRHLVKHGEVDGCTNRCLDRATPSKYRAEVSVDDAISHAIGKGWIVADGDRYRPGESQPA